MEKQKTITKRQINRSAKRGYYQEAQREIIKDGYIKISNLIKEKLGLETQIVKDDEDKKPN